MARLKKPDNETNEEAEVRRIKETVANVATRNEKTAWDRMMNNMVTILSTLAPVEEKILELTNEKNIIFDGVSNLRADMVKACVHPYTHLVYHEDHVICKFCERKFKPIK